MFLAGLAAILLVNLTTIDYDSGPKVAYDRNGIFDIFSTTAAVADTGGGGGGGPIQDHALTFYYCEQDGNYVFCCIFVGNECSYFPCTCFY